MEYFSEPEDINKVFDFVKNLWKRDTTKFSVPLLSTVHNCDIHTESNRDTQDTQKINTDKAARDHLIVKPVCDIYNIPFEIYVDTKHGTNCNVLLDDFKIPGMSIDKSSWKMIKRVEELYVCLKSGRFHICGKYCTRLEMNGKDHMYVCKYTGLSHGDVEMKHMYDYMHENSLDDKRLFKSSQNFNSVNYFAQHNTGIFHHKRKECIEEGPSIDGLDDALMNSELLSTNMFDKKDVTSKKTKDMDKKEKFLINTYSNILKMFSEERFKLEKTSTTDFEKEIYDEVQRYFNKCKQNHRIPVALEVYQLRRSLRNRDYKMPQLNLNASNRSEIALSYAKKCVCLWAIIRMRTKIGIENPNLFPTNNFLSSALDILENGLKISRGDGRDPIVIIERDDFLGTFLPQSNRTSSEKKGYRISLKNINSRRKQSIQDSVEDQEYRNEDTANDRYMNTNSSIRKIKGSKLKSLKRIGRKGKNHNKMRLDIERAITDSIANMYISPELLKIESMDYENIDRDIFYNVEGCTSNLRRNTNVY